MCLSDSFTELFKLIDEDNDNMLELLEIKEDSKKELIKQTTSKYIVKHSSEWHKEINMADVFLDIFNKHKEEIKNSCEIDDHYKKQKERIDKLSFFAECKDIEEFPQNDDVYHINPIGLVGEFLSKGCNLKYTRFQFLFNSNHEYGKIFFKELNEYCKLFKLETNLRKAHFIGQIAREVGKNFNVYENLNYSASVLKVKFSYFAKNKNEADLYGRTASHSANQEAIANRAYVNRIRNGDVASGDGWKWNGYTQK